MSNKYFVDDEDYQSNSGKKDRLPSFSSLRLNNELYDEEENIPHPSIRARRVSLPKNGENWEVVREGEVLFKIPGIRLNKKEKAYLRTAPGMNMLLAEYKEGTRSVQKIKEIIREILDND